MSRFIDKLKQTSRSEPQPMGFGKAAEIIKPRLLLVAEAKSAYVSAVEGADAVLLDSKPKNPPAETDLPAGVRLFGTKADRLEGIDFAVLLPDMPVKMVEDENIGRVMAVEASTEMGLLRSLESLPLDAVMIIGDGVQTPLVTWHYLMLCRRLAATCGKPLLASVAPDITRGELQLVWQAGVDGVVTAAKSAGGIKKLRAMIDKLIPPERGQRQKSRAIVPAMSQASTAVAEEEDEEYDDDEE